jgi:Protein of unknown function (DUF4058)
MPLLDHFHSPTKYVAPWSSIGTFWITSIVRSLNRTLPSDGFRAFAHVYLGHMVEADIAEFEMDSASEGWENTRSGGLATAVAPAPQLTFSPQFPDVFEVQIRDTKKGMTLVAVIEVVSPANKDRQETRRKLTRKCAGFLQIGVGVVIVDPVTNRSANLHNLIMAEIGGKKSPRLPNTPTYVSSYRPVGVEDDPILQVWCYEARLGEPIPSVPLPLSCEPLTMIDLEGTYLEALRDNGFTEADLRGTG